MSSSPFVNPEVVNAKLNNPKNVLHKVVGSGNRLNISKGMHRGKSFPLEFKALIGTLAKLDGNQKVVKEFDLTNSQVSIFKNSKRLMNGELIPDQELKTSIENKVEEINNKARDKILALVDAISPDEIIDANLQTKTKAASNLAGVIDKLGPKNDTNPSQPQFVFFGVPQKEINEYPTIEAEVIG